MSLGPACSGGFKLRVGWWVRFRALLFFAACGADRPRREFGGARFIFTTHTCFASPRGGCDAHAAATRPNRRQQPSGGGGRATVGGIDRGPLREETCVQGGFVTRCPLISLHRSPTKTRVRILRPSGRRPRFQNRDPLVPSSTLRFEPEGFLFLCGSHAPPAIARLSAANLQSPVSDLQFQICNLKFQIAPAHLASTLATLRPAPSRNPRRQLQLC